MSQRSVVIPVDNSIESERACRWAVDNLYRGHDEVHLLHIIPRLQVAAVYGAPPIDFLPNQDPQAYEQLIEDAEKFISSRFVVMFEDINVQPIVHIIKSEVDTDSIGEVVCKKSEELQACAVVMAKHQKSKVTEFFLGSVTNYCMHRCTRPVVVVH
eukprot:TRINITY_DN14383_c0_g1_i14.p3 TRINITY_DN14383_c0_g1~~TRINITY_DN14383_c0_g1_i14.p3  ORF type:complete len:156 (+),score=26.14 TRINITY_DN14383_c0_g1_i14:551-1018(+)